jgi:hypothetical protein
VARGKSFEGTPFAKAGLKIHPKRPAAETERMEVEKQKLMMDSIREAVIKGIQLMLVRMKSLSRRLLVEAIVSVVLDMEENEIITIEGNRAQIWNAHADEVAKILLKEVSASKAARNRKWNEPMQWEAMLLYEDAFKVLQMLKKTYFGSQAKRIRRARPDLKSWEDAKAEYPQLEGC